MKYHHRTNFFFWTFVVKSKLNKVSNSHQILWLPVETSERITSHRTLRLNILRSSQDLQICQFSSFRADTVEMSKRKKKIEFRFCCRGSNYKEKWRYHLDFASTFSSVIDCSRISPSFAIWPFTSSPTCATELPGRTLTLRDILWVNFDFLSLNEDVIWDRTVEDNDTNLCVSPLTSIHAKHRKKSCATRKLETTIIMATATSRVSTSPPIACNCSPMRMFKTTQEKDINKKGQKLNSPNFL